MQSALIAGMQTSNQQPTEQPSREAVEAAERIQAILLSSDPTAAAKIDFIIQKAIDAATSELRRERDELRQQVQALEGQVEVAREALEKIKGLPLRTYGDHWCHDKALDPEIVQDYCDAALQQLGGKAE